MGHKGSIERKYTLNKHKLPRQLFGAMRDQYLKASSFLTSESVSIESVEQKIEDVRAVTRREIEAARIETREQVVTEFEERLRNMEGMISDMAKMAALGLKFTPEGDQESSPYLCEVRSSGNCSRISRKDVQ